MLNRLFSFCVCVPFHGEMFHGRQRRKGLNKGLGVLQLRFIDTSGIKDAESICRYVGRQEQAVIVSVVDQRSVRIDLAYKIHVPRGDGSHAVGLSNDRISSPDMYISVDSSEGSCPPLPMRLILAVWGLFVQVAQVHMERNLFGLGNRPGCAQGESRERRTEDQIVLFVFRGIQQPSCKGPVFPVREQRPGCFQHPVPRAIAVKRALENRVVVLKIKRYKLLCIYFDVPAVLNQVFTNTAKTRCKTGFAESIGND